MDEHRPGYRLKAPGPSGPGSLRLPEALAAKGNPALRQREAAAREEGKAEGEVTGSAKAVVQLLTAR